MRILALTRYGLSGASSRMRFYQYLQPLQALGIEVVVSPLLREGYLERLYEKRSTNWLALLGDYLKQSINLLNASGYDLLWIEKELFPNLPAWFERMLDRRGIPYVVDFDDAIFHNYDLTGNPFKRCLAGKIDTVMRHATVVTCGNHYLAERARMAGARRVEIFPTVVDLDRYPPADPEKKDLLVIGWIGSPSTVKYLTEVAEPLKALAGKFPLQLRVVGAEFASPGLDVICLPWSEATEVSEIRKFDIGIMPLPDSPWEHGKCGYKLIQYMACGLPVVASPVGVNGEIVAHGVNGYLARTAAEWLDAFLGLADDKEIRRNIGARGRQAVERNYCLQVTAPRMAKLFHEVLAGRVQV